MKVVQIGSNKGYDSLSDHLLANYEELEFGLFVEANSLHIQSLKECYSKYDNAVVENIAVKVPHDDKKELILYYHVNDGPDYQVTSCKIDHIKKHYPTGQIKSFSVPCLTIDELFQKYNIDKLDWLLLDVEGIDAELALTFDWSKYDISRVEIEHLHLGNNSGAVHSLFTNLGYKQIPSLHEFDWAFQK